MRKRYDYRRQFKNMTEPQLKASLEHHRNELLKWIGIDQAQADNELKIISYLENK